MSDELKVNATNMASDTVSDMAETKGPAEGTSEDSQPNPTGKLAEAKERKLVRNVAGRTRFIATVPATGLLIASIVLAVGTIVTLVLKTVDFATGGVELHELTIEYVKFADAFLLAVALYILSIGLISLFVSDKIPLPSWLEFHDFDDLKERLTSVIIVMIGVSFLGHVLKGAQGIDTLWLGLGCAAIIAALSIFMREVFKHH